MALNCLMRANSVEEETPCKQTDILNKARFFWVQVAIFERNMGICPHNHYEPLKQELETLGFNRFLDEIGKKITNHSIDRKL